MLQEIRVYELCDQFEKALIERNYVQDGMYRTSDNGLMEFLRNLGKQN